MKKLYFLKKLIVVCLSFFILIFIVPVNYINADNGGTYTVLDNNACNIVGEYLNNGNPYYWVVKVTNATSEVRLATFHNGTNYYFIPVSQNSFRIYNTSVLKSSYSCNSLPTTGAQASTYNGSTYYYNINFNSLSSFSLSNGYSIINNVIGNFNNAVYYTFGDGSIDPTPPAPPVQAGELTFNYYTDFASNSQTTINAIKSNRDTITWDYDFTDSNISALDLKVDIRAIPVNYYSATEEDLKSLSWNSLNINASLYADLGSYHINYNMRKVSYTWEEVVNKISYISNLPDIYNNLVNDWNFNIFNLNNYYYWTGWVYQIRLNTDSGDYVGEWRTIYQVSSAPPDSATTTINYYVNGTGMTEPVYQTIQNINNQNNITNNTWYVNGSPFDVNDDTNSNWWEKLIELILNAVTGVFGKLIDAITDLILGSLEAIIEFFTNIWNGFIDLFSNIDFTDENNDYDITIPSDENWLQIIPSFVTGLNSADLGYMLWIPLVLGIIFIVL